MDAAVNQPDTLLLDVGDQHQGGRRLERRGPDIGGVAGEKLAQAGVAEVLAQRGPQVAHRHGPHQVRQVTGANALGQIQHRGAFGGNEGFFQRAVDGGAALHERPVAPRLTRPGESGDGVDGVGEVGEQVQPPARPPGMPGQDGGGDEAQAVSQVFTGVGEQ